jgi:hypothetical protein
MRFTLLFVSGAAEHLAALAIKCLAVAGGFLAGYLLGGAIAFALDRWVFNKKAPDLVKKCVRWVSGVILAIVVALIVFGEGGGGFGLGGGEGKGSGKAASEGDSKDKPASTPATPDKNPPQVSPVTPKDTRPAELVIRITILGGTDVSQERFYLIDDDRTPRTFAEVRAAVTARKAKDTRKAVLAIYFPPPPNRLPLEHPAVTQLVTWVRDEAGLDVTFPAGR